MEVSKNKILHLIFEILKYVITALAGYFSNGTIL